MEGRGSCLLGLLRHSKRKMHFNFSDFNLVFTEIHHVPD